ncbi:MAG: PEP-CTERM sorting domain-containing protein [Chthoniobacteraceae bacterium]
MKKRIFNIVLSGFAAVLLITIGGASTLRANTTTTAVTTATDSTTTTTSDFNTSSDQDYFNYSYSGTAAVYSSTAGLGSTGGFSISSEFDQNSIWTSKTALSNAKGTTFSISGAFYNSTGNAGFGLLGFSSTDTNSTDSTYPAVVSNSIEVAFHGGGVMLYSDGSLLSSWNWDLSSTASGQSNGDLAADTWFNVTLTLTLNASNNYDVSFAIYDLSGTLLVSETYNNVVSTALSSTSSIYGYVGASASRVTEIDDVTESVTTVDLVPEPSTYASLLIGGIAAFGMIRRGKEARV